MKPVMQTMFYNKDGVGNCFEACLASILEIELCEIPMFHEGEWFKRLWEWLQVKNLTYQGMLSRADVFQYKIGIDGYFIVAGESPRGLLIRGGHAVVFKDGKIVHDPHPNNNGILNIKYGLAIEKDCEN